MKLHSQPEYRPEKRKQGQKPDGETENHEDRQEDANAGNPTKRTKCVELPDPVSKLRLEAIFHPKFENERSDHQIREDMLSRVDSGKGYLEVSLKHSGSLVLWSGGHRFYSKNSTDNQFTYAAEILLQQHFERAWRNAHQSPLSNYHECSQHAEENRLTLSFELVTAVLGDHGDTPKRDFVVLTAIADRANERFYTTTEVLKFSQRFRLPHNDTWMFSSLSSAESLFRLYDTNMETGLATDTVEALTKAAEAHVPSMYPHVDFQGDILEGYIVRFVPYRDQPVDQVLETLAQLSTEANNILEQVPPELLASFEDDSISNENIPGLSVNIREIFQKVDGPQKGSAAGYEFADALAEELDRVGKRRRIERVGRKHVNLPALTQALTKSIDEETKRIALLLQKLTSLNKAVSYGFLQEEQPESNEMRHLCVIHILHDQAFLKFQRGMEPGDMALFRGFSIELSGEEPTPINPDSPTPLPEENSKGNDSLILKKKLLPYMVRTFICRNCLSIAQNNGSQAFVSQAVKLLNRWGISSAGKTKWIPFFEAWADYAVSCFENGGDPSLPPLSGFSYIAHLEHFTKLYERGELKQSHKSSFRGVVYVIAPTVSAAETIADCFGKALDGVTPRDVHSVANMSLQDGVVCYGSVADASKGIKRYLKEVSDYSTIVLFGCSDEDLKSELATEPERERKKTIGLCKSWRKMECAARVELQRSLLSDIDDIAESTPFQEAVTKIQTVSPSAETEMSTSPGLMLFFPQIPGCGKSTIVSSFEEGFEEYCSSNTNSNSDAGEETKRKILVRVGDKIAGSYWPTLKKDLRKNPSCILIADKNSPPPSWRTVVDLCSDSNSVPLAAFPDSWALQTTEVKGIRKSDGSFSAAATHIYPFSLAYLAVCMSRVLARGAKSHAGKLDSGTPTACMIVVMFFSLYRDISAEVFQETVEMKLSEASSEEVLPPVELPFFEGSGPIEMPSELQEVLVEALQLQVSSSIFKIR
jgi:hypothetical protein